MAIGDKSESPCPNCGHCPTCGRSNRWPNPWQYWPVPNYPLYPYPTTTYPTGTISGGSHFANGAN